MTWLLDTNVLIALARARPSAVDERVLARFRATPLAEMSVSSVTVAELWYGAVNSADPARRLAVWRRLLDQLTVAGLDRRGGEIAGRLRHALRHAPIGERDLFIAATALAHGCGVVTANVREFSRVPGLAVEDWTAG